MTWLCSAPDNKTYMKSMTGYATVGGETSGTKIEVSLRTVNGRFQEFRFHGPRELLSVEPQFRKIVCQVVQRGTIDLYVSRRIKADKSQSQVLVNQSLAREVWRAHQVLARSLGVPLEMGVESIGRWPEVLKVETADHLSASEVKLCLKLVDQVSQKLNEERLREGQALARNLSQLLKALGKQLIIIAEDRERANQLLKSRIEASLMHNPGVGDASGRSVSGDLQLLMEKADIAEELTRLEEHVKHYQALLKTPEAIGKKLDFYTQELLREVNTIGSKSHLSKMTRAVVEAKSIIERLREQVQNIE